MKKIVKVVIEKEIEIDLTNTLGSLTEEQFIEEWCSCLWEIKGLDDVFCHAAIMATSGAAGCNLDGLGKLVEYGEGDTKFKVIDEDVVAEIIS